MKTNLMNIKTLYLILLALICSLSMISSCFPNFGVSDPIQINTRDLCPDDFFTSHGMTTEKSTLLRLASIKCLDSFNVILYVENGIFDSIKGSCMLDIILQSSNIYLKETKQYNILNKKRHKIIVFLDAARKYFSSKTFLCTVGGIHSFDYDKFEFNQYEILGNIDTLKIYLNIQSIATDKTTVRVRLRYIINE